MRRFTTGLELAGVACALTGAYLLAGLGVALLVGSGLLFAASYLISRGGDA